LSDPARDWGRRVLIGVVFALCATAGLPRTSFSQQPLDGIGLALDLLEKLEYTRAGADAVTASMSLIEFEERYCLPPDPPSKAREREFLNARLAAVAEYERRFKRLLTELQNLIKDDASALNAVGKKFEGNPMDDQDWDSWPQAFARAKRAIQEKRKELEAKDEVRCRVPEPQQIAPDPTPPTGPGIDLPEPKVRPVAYPTYKVPFCSESDKHTVIQQFRAVAWDYYMNYQDARVYHDAITEALAQGRGNATVLRRLLTDARGNLDEHTKALDDFNTELDRVRAMRVIDCGQQPRTAPDEIPPLLFDPFVFPAVPAEFCSQEAKEETVRQLEAARNAARRNYDKAAARITELGDRITKGDNSTTTSAAFREANDRASEWLQQSRDLDAEMQRAAATPVVECATKVEPNVPEQHAFGTGIKVGYTLAATHFSNLKEVVGDRSGITDHSVDTSPLYQGLFVAFDLNSRFRFGGSAMFGTHSFTMSDPSGLTTGNLRGIFVDSKVSYVRPIGGVNLLAGGGITWTHDEISDLQHVNHEIERFPNRSVSGFMTSLGVAVEVPIRNNIEIIVGTDFITSFRRPNGDEHWRMLFAAVLNPFSSRREP
jgi:hypothetical protein